LRGQTLKAQTRREGDSLSFQCPYTAQESRYSKCWCLLTNGGCQELLYIYGGYSQESEKGRIKMKDDSTSRTVSITMTDLKAEDSGTYFCAVCKSYNQYQTLSMISLNVFKVRTPGVFQGPSRSKPRSQATSLCSATTRLPTTGIVLSVVLLILLLLALITCVVLGVRYYKLLERTGNRKADDTSDRPEGTAQPGSCERRKSSQDDSKGPAYINLDVQAQPSPEDPLYCNVEASQAPRSPQHVEYAVIAFNQPPRSSRE
ncbi:CLM1 protein, partial [Spelaeornis formosus]|nr:CLM1 protein [Elachura formosa]